MFQGNAGLKPKEGEVTSRPWQWPINYRVSFSVSNFKRMYYITLYKSFFGGFIVELWVVTYPPIIFISVLQPFVFLQLKYKFQISIGSDIFKPLQLLQTVMQWYNQIGLNWSFTRNVIFCAGTILFWQLLSYLPTWQSDHMVEQLGILGPIHNSLPNIIDSNATWSWIRR